MPLVKLSNFTNLFVILSCFYSFYAMYKVRHTFSKYKKHLSIKNQTGFSIAQKILDSYSINDVKIIESTGFLKNYYNPFNKTIVLSQDVYYENTITAIGIASHESGHAIQDKKGFIILKARNILVPIVNVTSNLSWFLLTISFGLGFLKLGYLGLLLFSLTLLFELITLPVEYDASNRALNILQYSGLVTVDEQEGIKKVLNSAALTYVASTITAIFQFLRYLNLISDKKRSYQ